MTIQTCLMRWLCSAVIFLTAIAESRATDQLCPSTSVSREWSATCFESTQAGKQVKKQYKDRLVPDQHGLTAIVITAPPELLLVDRHGRSVPLSLKRLSNFDFEPGEGAIARFGYTKTLPNKETVSKCGYYAVGKFRILVPPIYDQCDSFHAGQALVCVGCVDHCDRGDCHQSEFIGGEGIVINEKNEVVKRYQLPTVPQCSEDSDEQAAESGKCRRTPYYPRPEQQSIPEIDPIFAPKENKNGG